jgi:hypothetical protein
MCMVPCTLVSNGPDQVSWASLPGSDATEHAPEANAEVVMPMVNLFSGSGWCAAVLKFPRVVWALLRAI